MLIAKKSELRNIVNYYVLIAITITTFGFLIEAAVHSRKGANKPCEASQCISASSSLLNQIDETVDPCSDFFKFACGAMYQNKHTKNTPLESFLAQLHKRMISFLNEPINHNDGTYFNFGKKLFTGCISESKDGTSLKALKSVLADLGGWPLLGRNEWNETNFHWVDLISRLKEKGLNYKLLLDVSLQKESVDNNTLLMLHLPYSHYDLSIPNYINLMIEIAVALGVEADTATEEMTKVFNFSMKLEQLRKYQHDNTTRILLSDLQSRHAEINWTKIVNLNIEHLHTASQNDYIEGQYPGFINDFVSLLTTTNLSTLANYIFWFGIADILPLVSNQALEVSNQFYRSNKLPTRDLVEECEENIFRTVNLTSLKVAYAKRYTPETARRKAQKMLDYIVKEFKKMISGSSWMDEETIIKTYNWLDNFKYVIGVESYAVDNLEIPKTIRPNDPFLTKFLQLKKERNDQDLLEIKYKNATTAYYAHFQTPTTLLLTDTRDTIMFPPPMLQGLYFDENRPMYMNFGVLGASMSSNLVSYYISETINKDIWSQGVRKMFTEKINCVKHNSEQFGNSGIITKGAKRSYINSKVSKHVGLKLAYNAYKSWLQENENDPVWVRLNYTDAQLFWISSFSNACYENDKDTNYYTDNEYVRQNFKFAIDFGCSSDSNMNPTNKCVVF